MRIIPVLLGAVLGAGVPLLVGCGVNTSNSLSPNPPSNADFSLTASPSTLSLTAGAAGQTISVTATALNGFTGSVSVSLSGLAAGVTASPSSLTLTPGAAQTLTLTAGSSAAAEASTITLTGTSGSHSHTATVALTVTAAAAPDFSLTVAPASVDLTAGASGQTVAVTANAINGFTGSVSVSLAGLPTGVTATPATLTLIPGSAQNLTLTAAASAAGGMTPLTVTGTSGSLTHTAPIALTVTTAPPASDFSLTVAPTSLSLSAGATGKSVSVTATALNGFTGSVSVSLSGLPAGVTASPSTLTLTPGVAQNLTVTAGASAVASTDTVTLTGTSGTLTHTATVALTVTSAAAAPDFSLTVAPTSLSLTTGATGKPVSVTANALNGFTGKVSLSLSGLPSGVTGSPSTLPLTPGVAQSLTLSASTSAKAGTATVTLTGVSGTLTHSATLSLTIAATAPSPDFSLTIAPTTLSVTAGAAGKPVSVTANALNGFTGKVSLSLSGLPTGVTATPATLTLTPGVAQSVTLSPSASTNPGTATVTLTGVSGTLTHSATVALTITATAPSPDFTLTAAPTSLSLTAGAAGKPVSVTANALNGFTGKVILSLSGLPTGVTATPSTLTLTPGVAQSLTLSASTSAAAGTATITFTGTSGTLTHSATISLTIAAAPAADFSLTVNPASLTLTAGGAGQPTSVTANALNGFTGSVSLSLSGLPTGVTASPSAPTLTPGTAQSLTFTAASNAAAGTATITFTGTSGTLTHTATLKLTVNASAAAGIYVTTYHYDNSRDGLNASETTLTPSNVNSTSFGKINLYATDGKVDAAPLYLSGMTINGQTHNVLYVVSEHDSVYAFDADTGSQLWQITVLGNNETTSGDHNCGQISPEIGITATPVIDRSYGTHGAIFVVGMTLDSSGNYHHRLHALDLTTGAELSGGPTEISATYPGNGLYSNNGQQEFLPSQYAERVGLLLMNGTIYMGWTSHCDQAPYTGWLMGYSEQTLKQTAVLNLTPNTAATGNPFGEGEGSIWMSGAGLAADTSGNIYFLDANGGFDSTLDASGFPIHGDYGNAFMKVSTANGKLAVADYFNTSTTVTESNDDTDLGSGGVLLLPDQTDASGNVRQLAVGAGKDRSIYIADRNNMGKFNSVSNNIYQQLSGALANGEWGMPAWFNGTVYYGGQGDVMKAFSVVNAQLLATPSSQSATVFSYPGTTPSVSANGTTNGVVWAVENSSGNGVLHAYDATNLGNELYNSNQAAAGRDSFTDNKFITPVVANGRVFVGTTTGVVVFGLLH